MPKKIRNEFRTNGCTAHVQKRKTGYEIRYRRNGYNVTAYGTTLEDAKKKFILKLKAADDEKEQFNAPTTFHEFAMYYFETFRKRKVKDTTYKGDMARYNHDLKPHFGSTPLKSITPGQCQKLLDKLSERGLGKTVDEIYSLLNVIFKGAIAHNIIQRNPLAIVYKDKHENEHGKALTKNEENKLLKSFEGTKFQIIFAVALYTGLRPNELKTAVIGTDFIVAVNSKRKSKKVEYKKIPISPMLRPYLNGETKLDIWCSMIYIREKFKEVLPNHKLYDLRTTFNTRCQECGVADVARMSFMGHSLGALANAYTDLSEEFLLKEGKKLQY